MTASVVEAPPVPEADPPAAAGLAGGRWRIVMIGAAVAVALLLGGYALARATGAGSSTGDPAGTEPSPTTAEAVVTDLSTEFDATAEVAYGEPWAVPLQLQGIVTAVPAVGANVAFGQELVRVDDMPTFLAEGAMPMYRELSLTSPRLVGDDVAALQRFLLAAGFDDDGALSSSGSFGYETRDALRDWQEAVGLDETGAIGPDRLVISATPLRIAAASRVGTRFDALSVTQAEPVVAVSITAAERSSLPVGAAVEVELPDGTRVPGTVTAVDREVDDEGGVSYRATVTVAGTIPATATSVVVHSSVVEASDVLVVPTSALLAVPGGEFEVEVLQSDGTVRAVPVEVGAMVDGRAEVSGELAAGDQVVVPS
jgi:peptidoglycan hydrolase-like protein with peptidoglycan-binding domain